MKEQKRLGTIKLVSSKMFAFSDAFSRLTGATMCPEYPRCSRGYCPFSHRLLATTSATHNNKQSTDNEDTDELIAELPTETMRLQTEISAPPERVNPGKRKHDKTAVNSVKSEEPTQVSSSAKLCFDPSSKVGLKQRQRVVDAFCKQFNRILGSRADASIKEAWELEKLIHEQCTPQTYQALAAPVLQRLCKTSPLMDSKELDRQFLLTGKHSIPGANVSTVSIDEGKLFAMLLTAEQLAELEYPLIDARAIPDYATQRPITRDCERCGKVFLPASCQSSDECCIFHWGKLNRDQLNGQQLKVYRCCGAELGTDGCNRGPHVFKIGTAAENQRLYQFRRWADFSISAAVVGETLIAIDGEMAYTTNGMELLRLSAVNAKLNVLFDVFVEPEGAVLDYNTRWSGITAESFAAASERISLTSAQDLLFSHMSAETILIGHSLDSDLIALRIAHDRIIDTSVLYQHHRGLPYRYSLQRLVTEYLRYFIQDGSDGHDSIEDAKAAMELVLKRLATTT